MDFSVLLSLACSPTAVVPATASYPFVTAFLVTFLGRMIYFAQRGDPFISIFPLQGLANVQNMELPHWFIGDLAIGILCLLALAEIISQRNATFLGFFNGFQTHAIKPVIGFALAFGLIEGQAETILETLAFIIPQPALAWLVNISPTVALASSAPVVVSQAEVLGWIVTIIAVLWAAISSFLTWQVALIRQGFVDLLIDGDEDDSLGLIKLFGFFELGWTATTTIILVLSPLVALGLAGITVAGLFLLRKWAEQRDERSKIACASCNGAMYPTALFCPACRQANETPRMIGVFGQAKSTMAPDRTAHHLNLLARKRCPSCATRLAAKAIHQTCLLCDTATFADISEANRYIRALDAKLIPTLVVCGVLGCIPFVGLVPGIVYYRLSLIASLRGYIPRSVGCFTRFGLRCAAIMLVGLQPFFLGWLTLPALALMNYMVYRQVFVAGFKTLPQQSLLVPSAPLVVATPASAEAVLPDVMPSNG